MTLTLPKSVMDTLPEPDRDGNIRVVVSMQVGPDGEANVSEVNDVPVSGDGEDAEMDPETEADPGDEANMPSPDDIASQVMQG